MCNPSQGFYQSQDVGEEMEKLFTEPLPMVEIKMAIETLNDIAENMADALGIYGNCLEQEGNTDCACRCCWISGLVQRMKNAAQVEWRLNQ